MPTRCPIVKNNIMRKTTVFASNAASLKEILTSDQSHLFSHELGYGTLLNTAFGENILTTDDQTERDVLERLLHDALSEESVRSYIPICRSIADRHLKSMCNTGTVEAYESLKNVG
jgi:cytochrome P450